MKTRRTKVLLSLLAVMAAGFAVTNAYTFQVQNRNPFGVLNLSKLIIKPDTSTESMILSGYTLKIMTDQGKIKVHQICNEKEGEEEYCIDINSNLGNGGGNGSGITATGTVGDFCKLKSDGNLECNDDLLAEIAAIQAAIAELTSPNDGTLTIKQGNKTRYFSANTGTNVEINLASGGNGDTIISGALVTQTGANTGYYCSSTDGETLICNNVINANGSGITATGTTGRYCKLKDNGDLDCDLDPETIGEGGLMLGNTTSGGYCKYSCMDKNEFNGLNDSKKEEFLGGTQGITQGDLICVITCTDTNVGGDDNHWTNRKYTALGPIYLTPIPNNNIMLRQELQHTGAFIFRSYHGGPVGQAASVFTFDSKGIRIGATAASISTGAGLSVQGIIAAGSNISDNYIYMYATGQNSDIDKHYEIMGNSQLAIGTNGGAFLYFTQKTGTYYPQHLEYLAGQATNSYIPGYCGIAKSNDGNSNYTLAATNSNDEGESEGGVGTIGGGGGGGEYTCQPSQGHQRSSVDVGVIPTTEVYQSLMVGVNTNTPNATLDVNGSIRVGSNCVDDTTSCTIETAGTIMYVESNVQSFLLICKQTTNGFMWHDLIGGTEHEYIADFGVTQQNLGCSIPKPTPGPNPNVIQQGQLSESYPLQY